MRAHRQVNVREARLQIADRVERWFVVGVGADEEVVVVVVDRGDVVLHHAADDGVLVPQRHEDGDLFFRAAGVRLRFAACVIFPGGALIQAHRQTASSARSSRPLSSIAMPIGTRHAATNASMANHQDDRTGVTIQ